MNTRGLLLAVFAFPLSALFTSTVSGAGPLYIDSTMTDKALNGNGTGTGTVLAYTNDNGKVNAFTDLLDNQVDPTYHGAANVYNTLTIPASVPNVPANKVPKFSPPVGLSNFTKNTATVGDIGSSQNAEDPNVTLNSFASITAKAGKNPLIDVHANTVVAKNAYAAARGVDPQPILAGTMELNPTIQISLGIRPGDLFAGTEMAEQLASLSSPLWSLSVYATGTATGSETPILSIEFTSLPSLGLDDNQIAQDISNSFTLSADSAVMNQPMTFFDAFYNVPSNDTYSDYVNGSIATPEPSTLILAALGGLALLVYRCRK